MNQIKYDLRVHENNIQKLKNQINENQKIIEELARFRVVFNKNHDNWFAEIQRRKNILDVSPVSDKTVKVFNVFKQRMNNILDDSDNQRINQDHQDGIDKINRKIYMLENDNEMYLNKIRTNYNLISNLEFQLSKLMSAESEEL